MAAMMAVEQATETAAVETATVVVGKGAEKVMGAVAMETAAVGTEAPTEARAGS